MPDENLLGADVLEMLLNYEHTPIRDLRVSQVINDITSIMRRHGLTLPGDLVMLFKTLITLEGVVKRLDGSIELLERAKPITEAAVKEQASAAHIARNAKTQLRTLLQMAESLPQDFFRLTRMLQKGKFGITLDLKQSDRISHQIDSAANRLTMGIVTAALIIGSSATLSPSPTACGLSGRCGGRGNTKLPASEADRLKSRQEILCFAHLTARY